MNRRSATLARRALTCCAAVASLFLARQALATVTVVEPEVKRSMKMRDAQSYPLYISKSDCSGSDAFTFPVQLSTDVSTGSPIEVWVGDGSADCSLRMSRESDGGCKRIEGQSKSVSDQKNGLINFEIPSSSIATAAGAKNCEDSGGSTSGRAIGIFFLVIDDSGAEQLTQYAKWAKTSIDLVGPSPPTKVAAASSENALAVSWDQTENDDVAGYYVYCDTASESATGSGGEGGAPGTGGEGDGGAAAGEGGATSGEGGADSGNGGADSGNGGASASTGTGGSTAEATCTSSKLKQGSVPASGAKQCAKVQKSSKAEAAGLTNGVRYAVAVAAYDKVGNAGALSALACGEPGPVDDFFELYRKYGGEAGGGFCGYALPASGTNTSILGFGAAVAAALVARRARARRQGAVR